MASYGLTEGRAHVTIRGLTIVGPPGGSCVDETLIHAAMSALSSEQQMQMIDGELIDPHVFIEGRLLPLRIDDDEVIE